MTSRTTGQPTPPARWKPGLASKRIATPPARPQSDPPAPRWKPGLASKRIATDPLFYCLISCLLVGNQDSLQRGLRRARLGTGRFQNYSLLETRTRFKEDCDAAATAACTPSAHELETRTRFKEDCDGGVIHSFLFHRKSWKPGLASKRIATDYGITHDAEPDWPGMLETRTRFKEDCDRGRLRRHQPPLGGWKPGLASKRIATVTGVTARTGSTELETRTRFKEDCDAAFLAASSLSSRRLETRTRFKEDCDMTATIAPVPVDGRLETRTRFKEDCDTGGTEIH